MYLGDSVQTVLKWKHVRNKTNDSDYFKFTSNQRFHWEILSCIQQRPGNFEKWDSIWLIESFSRRENPNIEVVGGSVWTVISWPKTMCE